MDDPEHLSNLIKIIVITVMACKIYIRSKVVFRRWWTKPHLSEFLRNKYGMYTTLFVYFKLNDHEEFFNFTRMTLPQFQKLHDLVAPRLVAFNPSGRGRRPLPTEFKLAAVLNYLANGNSVRTAAWMNRIGLATMYELIPKVCEAIVMSLKDHYIQFPNSDEWKTISNNFYHQWQIPNCLGAIDGKHIRIKAPPHSGSFFFNYKKYKSLILMAASDAFHRFIWLNVGDYGHQNDAGIFNHCDLGIGLENQTFDLPEPQYLPGTQIKLPFFFIGDGGFGLRRYLITPFIRNGAMNYAEKVFNYRLSRARRIIECAFGIMVQKWRISETAMNFKLETIENIVLAIACLHNFLISTELVLAPEARRYVLEEDIVEEDVDENDYVHPDGLFIRNTLTNYFVTEEGSIDFQWLYI